MLSLILSYSCADKVAAVSCFVNSSTVDCTDPIVDCGACRSPSVVDCILVVAVVCAVVIVSVAVSGNGIGVIVVVVVVMIITVLKKNKAKTSTKTISIRRVLI